MQMEHYLQHLKPAKTFRNNLFRSIISTISFLCALNIFSSVSYANPTGGRVAAGTATITQPAPNQMQINQTSDRASINWQSFNIGAQESTHFQQPAGGIVLNRINPTQGVSSIYGRLTATGQIILINPAGIYFGPTAFVNVGGLIATTANLTDQDFLRGNYKFTAVPGYAGAIINKGTIVAAEHGLVALMGNSVQNDGLIEANLGQVVLGSGNAFTMTFAGNDLISFSIDQEALSPGGVKNTGTLRANGGKVLVSAHAASNVLDNVINMEGVTEARAINNHNGEIILSANPDGGAVRVAGKLDVSGRGAGEKGGKVVISGKQITIDQPTLIDASGDRAGGSIFIGGNKQGKGPLPNAKTVRVAKNTSFKADAITLGDGGTVIVWADDTTQFYGNIFARGGAQGGNGGFVETSGKEKLDIAGGRVDASAPLGRGGEWLLDPRNVAINNNTTTCTAPPCFSAGDPTVYTPDTNTSNVNVTDILAALEGGTSVTITTGTTGNQAGTIAVNTPITKTAGATSVTLTLDSSNGGSTITVSNPITSTSGSLGVVLTSNNAITISAAISTNGGDFTSTAPNTISINAPVTTSGGNFAATSQNAISLAAGVAVDAGAGTVSFNANQDGTGGQDFTMNAGSSITTTNTGASAVGINVNVPGGGNGTAVLDSITTGSGGTLSIATNNGGNTSGGSITMPNGGSLDVGTGTVSLTTSQAAARAIGTTLQNIQISAGNLITSTGGGGTFITNTGTGVLNLNTNTGTTGQFNLTSLNSAGITNNGTLTLPGTTTIAAGATQDINLTSPANNFATVAITSGRNVSLLDTNAIVLAASTISGNLDLTAGGSVTQSGVLTVMGTPTFTLTIGSSDISLAGQANNFATTPIFTSNGNIRDILLRNVNAGAAVPILPSGLRNLTLTFNNAPVVLPAVSLSGNLSTTASGSISQTGALTIAGTAAFTASTANTDVLLADFANTFTTTPTFTNNGNIRDFALRRTGSGAIPTLPSDLRNVTLIYDTNAIALPMMTLTGNLSATANGSITQSGILTVPGSATFTVTTANSDISLASRPNDFSNAPVYTNNGNIRDLLLRNTNVGALVPTLPTGLRNLTLTFNNAAMVLPTTTLTGTFTGTALGSMLVNGNFTTGGNVTATVNTGTFAVADAATLLTNNHAINITATDLNLNTTGTLNSGSANTVITQNTAGGTIGLGNTLGTMSISGAELQRISSNNLTLTAPSDGRIDVDGISAANSANVTGTVILTATAGTLGTIHFLNAPSSFRRLTATADDGITVDVDQTSTVGNISLSAAVGGGLGHTLNLNADLTAAGNITLSASTLAGIVLGAPVVLTGNGITFNPNVSGAFSLTVDASGTARFNNPVSVADLVVSAGIIALNGGSVTTTGDQTYNAIIDFGNNATLTGQNITFNDDITGNGINLIVNGQPGDNQFTFNGPSGLATVTVTGSGDGNNTLAVNVGAAENWAIPGTDQGSITSTEITGGFNFSQIQNLTGGTSGNTFTFSDGASINGIIDGSNTAATNTLNYNAYTTPVNVSLSNVLYAGNTKNNAAAMITNFVNINDLVGSAGNASILRLPTAHRTLTFNTSYSGVVADPTNFNQFSHFFTANSADPVFFVAHGIYDLANGSLTINGAPVQLVGFDPNNFFGNITFINRPIPPLPPIPTIDVSVADVITPFNSFRKYRYTSVLPYPLITDMTDQDFGGKDMTDQDLDGKGLVFDNVIKN